MKKKIETRGRKSLPAGEKKVRVYVLVKEKYVTKVKELITKAALKYT